MELINPPTPRQRAERIISRFFTDVDEDHHIQQPHNKSILKAYITQQIVDAIEADRRIRKSTTDFLVS